jgi:hypothetical protein
MEYFVSHEVTFQAGFVIDLFFHPEDGDDIFLRIVD